MAKAAEVALPVAVGIEEATLEDMIDDFVLVGANVLRGCAWRPLRQASGGKKDGQEVKDKLSDHPTNVANGWLKFPY